MISHKTQPINEYELSTCTTTVLYIKIRYYHTRITIVRLIEMTPIHCEYILVHPLSKTLIKLRVISCHVVQTPKNDCTNKQLFVFPPHMEKRYNSKSKPKHKLNKKSTYKFYSSNFYIKS